MEQNNIDFFISHSRETKQKIAIPITQLLTDIGFNIWFDRKGISTGQYIYPQIENAILSSKYCIAIIDKSFLERTWTITELEYFHKKEKCNILPIFVKLDKDFVYSKIPWLNGIAFESMSNESFDIKLHMNILCRIINRYYFENITSTIDSEFKVLYKYNFPCRETLMSLLEIKEYYSHDFRLAIISLCNINDIIYAIFNSISTEYSKILYIISNFTNYLKCFCYDAETTPNYNIYISAYNAAVISIKELEILLHNKKYVDYYK